MADDFQFEKLMVWQKARKLTADMYRATESFPKSEMFGLTGQMRRAAVSIVANIAEGSARRTPAVLANHLDIAIGSTAELLALIQVAEDVGYLAEEQGIPLRNATREVSRMLRALHGTIRRKL